MATENSSISAEGFTPFNVAPNVKRMNEIARNELGETTELKEECLKQLRDLIKDKKVICATKDDFLLRFLRTKKFDVQRSFQAIQNYAKQRITLNSLLVNLQPEKVKAFLRHSIFGILPYCDVEDRVVVFSRAGAWNPGICSPADAVMTHLLLMYYVADKESSQINGVITIHDGKDFPLSSIPLFLRYSKIMMGVILNGLPIRYPVVHYINESSVIKYILLAIHPFIPEKIRNRMLFHGTSREILLQHLDPSIMPDDFGGNLGPVNCDHLTEEILEYLEKMKDEQRYFLT